MSEKQESSKRRFLPGELLDDKYRIENLLGQGGMGAVYRATHLATKRIVAVKVIRAEFSDREEFVKLRGGDHAFRTGGYAARF